MADKSKERRTVDFLAFSFSLSFLNVFRSGNFDFDYASQRQSGRADA